LKNHEQWLANALSFTDQDTVQYSSKKERFF